MKPFNYSFHFSETLIPSEVIKPNNSFLKLYNYAVHFGIEFVATSPTLIVFIALVGAGNSIS